MSYTVLQCPVLTAKERPHRRFSQPMKALFKLFRRFDARRIFGFIRRLGGMSRPKVKCYDLRSTRALRVEGDLPLPAPSAFSPVFLSTPSGWRATTPSQMPFSNEKFLSTPSGWRATCPKAPAHPHAAISIHALRVEGDCSSRGSQGRRGRISIHALRVEGDKRLYCFGVLKAYFYPRPPGGGRQNCIASIISRLVISIHALRVEGDPCGFCFFVVFLISIHALRVEGDSGHL